jgi:hypothetical protein
MLAIRTTRSLTSHVSYCKGIILIAGFAGFALFVAEDSTSGRRFGVAEIGTLLVDGLTPRLLGSSASRGGPSVAVGVDGLDGRLRFSVEDAVIGGLVVMYPSLDWIAANDGEYCVLESLVRGGVKVDCDDVRGEAVKRSREGWAPVRKDFGDDLEEGRR